MGKRSRRERRADFASAATPEEKVVRTRTRTLQMVTVAAVIGIVLSVLMRHSPAGGSGDPAQGGGFTPVGVVATTPAIRLSAIRIPHGVAERGDQGVILRALLGSSL